MKIFALLPFLLLSTNFWANPSHKALPTFPSLKVISKAPVVRTADADMIPWEDGRRLYWEDFRCAPQKEGEAVASTSTSLGVSYEVYKGELQFHISCNFSKQKSWGLLKTDYILMHEQGHFDITELFARRLYQALSTFQYNAATVKKDIAAIYLKNVTEKEAMQAAYDGETDHSRRRKLQFDWLDKISDLLTASEAYANYP